MTSAGTDFSAQVVLVTGSGRGLGEAYARLFADLGAAVVVHDAGVAPGVVALASPAMTSSGHVLAAAGGSFRLDAWTQGPTVDLGRHPAPQDVLAAWPALEVG